jgi:hypothetical protein
MAYTFNFTSKSNVNYSNKEKEKKSKKWYMTGPLRNLDLSQEIYFLISHISFIFPCNLL